MELSEGDLSIRIFTVASLHDVDLKPEQTLRTSLSGEDALTWRCLLVPAEPVTYQSTCRVVRLSAAPRGEGLPSQAPSSTG